MYFCNFSISLNDENNFVALFSRLQCRHKLRSKICVVCLRSGLSTAIGSCSRTATAPND